MSLTNQYLQSIQLLVENGYDQSGELSKWVNEKVQRGEGGEINVIRGWRDKDKSELCLQDLSEMIDKYLQPSPEEAKGNAEETTPYELRRDMMLQLNIRAEYSDYLEKRGTKIKFFEPSAGKGGFVISIISHLMYEFQKKIPDEKQRYKTIVEDCLYFSYINPKNIEICKILIDPFNEYSLNYHIGDTLKLNTKLKWGISEFDIIIGNPPFNPIRVFKKLFYNSMG